MKHFYLLAFLPLVFSASVTEMDADDNLGEDAFEEEFGLEKITDPEEHKRREEALKNNEEIIKETNNKFLDGEDSWWDKVNEFSDLPEDEFEAQKTGELKPNATLRTYGLGLIHPADPADRYEEASERYFDQFRYSRASVPDSYSSVDEGNVSPVRSQGSCGSCVAFANMALVETCFKKVTGVFGDYSEQQLLDCGYDQYGAAGCDGAPAFAYAKWADVSGTDLSHESQYAYKGTETTLTCPSDLESYNQGVKLSGNYYTYSGDEETMKKLLYTHGAVGTAVKAAGEFSNYGGGVFAGCTGTDTDHAVTAVGYGTEDGVDYWLVKNSWGSDWGENGYIKLKRGVNMCGIGSLMVTVECETVDGATDAPLTTATPCEDKYSNCATLAKTNCNGNSEHCQKSCGLCSGMTPVASNTCYDTWNNCETLAETSCYDDTYKTNCCISCGLGEGMTPAASNTCYDLYSNCSDLCDYYPDSCKKSCGTC